MLANTLVYGFVNSVILVLVALGFNLTFGISGVANFAYGALYILGALLCWIFFNSLSFLLPNTFVKKWDIMGNGQPPSVSC